MSLQLLGKMHQRDDFHLIKQHPVYDTVRCHMHLPHLQIESLMHGMPYMWMQRENIRAFNDSGCHSIRIKCRILGDVGPDGPQILPGLA